MKRIFLLLLMVGTIAAYGQKQQKPNLNKAIGLWKEGKLKEAKEMIDAATTFEKTMNDGKTWYYRGLIYSTIDTTSNAENKALDPNAFNVAMESFAQAKKLGKAGQEYFIQETGTVVPTTQSVQMENLANYYLQKGIDAFQEQNDNVASINSLNKTKKVFESGIMEGYRNDTLTYYVLALVAQQSDSLDLAIDNARKYMDKGGKSKDIYNVLYTIYNGGPKEDKNKALEVVREARKKFPNNADFPKMEIGLLIDMGKIDEARTGLEQAVKDEPNNKVLHFYLGYARMKADDLAGAQKAFEDALKLDPNYFEAQFYLANTYLVAVDKTSKELSATGNRPQDSKKRSELVQKRVKESETALPYLERAEKMQAPDKDSQIEVLQKLSLLYYYTADDKNSDRVAKKLKALGVED